MAESVTPLDRFRGTLLGLACGDALGASVEFESREAIAEAFPGGLRHIVGGGWLNLAPGEVTDDTELTLALAAACTGEPSGIAIDTVVANFLAWYRSNPRDVGTTTRAALVLLADGAPWDEAGERIYQAAAGGAAGNGAVMRCAPVALRFWRRPADLVRWSRDTARVTHADPRTQWGAVAVNQAIAHLLAGGPKAGVLNAAQRDVPNPDVRAAIQGVPRLTFDTVKSGGYVLDTLAAALWCFMSTASADEAIVRAINLGQDTDTTGAVTGALAGAHYGEAGLPVGWLEVLDGAIRDQLVAHAERLFAHAAADPDPDPSPNQVATK